MEKLNAIREQVIQLCDPQKILLFGSQAKGTATAKRVPSRFMRKFICRLRLNEVSRQ